jgi:hypothetical protein
LNAWKVSKGWLMHPQTVCAKTLKGIQEVENRNIRLSRDLGLLFLAVDGRRPVFELLKKTGMDETSLAFALARLLAEGYIKVIYQPPPVDQDATAYADLDLDFT